MNKQMIVDALRAQVEAAKVGARLPSARELAIHHGVSRAQMNQAVDTLIGAGVIRRDGYRLFAALRLPNSGYAIHFFSPEAKHSQAALEASEELGLRAVIHAAGESNAIRKDLLKVPKCPGSGVLMWYARNLDLLGEMELAGMEVVVCGSEWPGHSYVTGNNEAVVRMAIHYLMALGHLHVTLMIRNTSSLYPNLVEMLTQAYDHACDSEKLPNAGRKIEVVQTEREIREAWHRLLEQSRSPTAILCSDILLARHLSHMARQSSVKVPDELSLLSLMEGPMALQCDPPMSTVALDENMMTRLAVFLLASSHRDATRGLGLKKHYAVECAPALNVRGSTGPVAPVRQDRPHASGNRWPDDPERRRRAAAEWNERVHAPLPKASDLVPLDLLPHVNRGFTPRSAWLGDQPLLHFKPGKHRIHGIPFVVASGKRRHSAIVLRSGKVHSDGEEALPLEVRIPVERRAKTLFFLHAGGWTVRHEVFACYELHYADGSTATLDILALGHMPPGKTAQKKAVAASLLQDWHPSYEPFASKNVLPFLVMNQGDPFLYERYLYSCRWPNPHPGKRIKEIRVRSLNPKIRTTLALLAITLESAGAK